MSEREKSLFSRGDARQPALSMKFPTDASSPRIDEAEYALETEHGVDDEESADEEDLSSKIAILERLRGRRGMYLHLDMWLRYH